MRTEILINDFATRSFRDVGDQDYIAARLSYRHGLYSQFHWQSLQAIEKYFKAILLYNRIKADDINHDLDRALKHAEKLPFKLSLSRSTIDFLSHLSRFGRFRYLESSYFVKGPKLLELDKSVWEIRRYCKVLNYEIEVPDGQVINMLEPELEHIERSTDHSPHRFKLIGGLLERIVDNPTHVSRSALVWQNPCFTKTTRKTVRVPTPLVAVNSPLYLNPQIVDEVRKYVFLPSDVLRAYRDAAKKHKP